MTSDAGLGEVNGFRTTGNSDVGRQGNSVSRDSKDGDSLFCLVCHTSRLHLGSSDNTRGCRKGEDPPMTVTEICRVEKETKIRK